MRKLCLAGIAVATFVFQSITVADYFAFGGSFGGGGIQENELELTFADSSTATLDTNTSNFDPGTRNQGWWSDVVGNDSSNDNYATGFFIFHDTNNFFTFDIGNLSPTVTSVSLELVLFEVANDFGSGVNVRLYDVATDAATLNQNDAPNSDIFNDLGSGNLYGSLFLPNNSNDPNQVVSFSLNAAGVADLNQAIANGEQFFSIGGTASAIPEPTASFILLLTSVCGLARRRRVIVTCDPRRSWLDGRLHRARHPIHGDRFFREQLLADRSTDI